MQICVFENKSKPPAENKSGGHFVKAEKGGETNGRENENRIKKIVKQNDNIKRKQGEKNSTPRNSNKRVDKRGQKNRTKKRMKIK